MVHRNNGSAEWRPNVFIFQNRLFQIPRVNLYLPKKLRERMKQHPNVNWPRAIHSIVLMKLDELDASASVKEKTKKDMFGAAKGKLIAVTHEDRWNDRDSL